MPAEEVMAAEKKKNVLVGIQIDSRSRELLSWALVKVAEPRDCVIAVHVCKSSEHALKDKSLLDGYLEAYDGLCSVKQVDLTGQVFKGNSVRKTLVREAKNHSAVALVVGISKQSALGSWASMAKYCSKRLPSTTDVLAIHNGKIVFRKFNNNQLPALKKDPKPSNKDNQSDFGDSEVETEKSSFEARDSFGDSKDETLSIVHECNKFPSRSISLAREISEQKLGWPLQRVNSVTPQDLHVRQMSVVQWVMSLPNRYPQQTLRCLTINENSFEKMSSIIKNQSENQSNNQKDDSSRVGELQKILLKTNSLGFEWFSYEVLETATSRFSSENLIGKGGCNHVYKGILPDGKPVAIKILKTTAEAWNDFAHEIEIISSLKHKHITHLLGVCIQDNDLISVYDLLSKGSLEERLHERGKDKAALSWETRFNVAVAIAEALTYLHNECSRPVIHRDVKSSNILLNDEFEPQLSDFGLAIWGPTSSSFLTQVDVVGTFGYLAPEYFMYGKVSDKIDVYAFGIVLLELLSGRKPIGFETPKGQESLVMWAKPKIESGDIKGILDSNLGGKLNEVQVQRMVLAATLCITRASRFRPKMREILKLLRGDKDVEKWVGSEYENLENQDDNDDEVYPTSSAELHLGLAMLDVDDDSTSISSVEHNNNLSWEDYLKERWSRSSSFN